MTRPSNLPVCLLLALLLAACDGAAETGTLGGQPGTGGTGAANTGGASSGGGGTGGNTGGASTGGTAGTAGTAGTGGEGGTFVPDPIPVLPEDPPPPCQKAIDTPDYFQFLDNLCDEKVWPSAQDRDRPCPTLDLSPTVTLADGTTVEYKPSTAPLVVDGNALTDIVPDGMDVTVILIRRVNGVPHYRYISNGTHYVAYQPWSTTKVFAAANAASNLRIQSNYKVGLTASAGATPLGD
ncbi:MAG: hypothetical protein R3B70_38375, partial [Polyangiaceae bacterium]